MIIGCDLNQKAKKKLVSGQRGKYKWRERCISEKRLFGIEERNAYQGKRGKYRGERGTYERTGMNGRDVYIGKWLHIRSKSYNIFGKLQVGEKEEKKNIFSSFSHLVIFYSLFGRSSGGI